MLIYRSVDKNLIIIINYDILLALFRVFYLFQDFHNRLVFDNTILIE